MHIYAVCNVLPACLCSISLKPFLVNCITYTEIHVCSWSVHFVCQNIFQALENTEAGRLLLCNKNGSWVQSNGFFSWLWKEVWGLEWMRKHIHVDPTKGIPTSSNILTCSPQIPNLVTSYWLTNQWLPTNERPMSALSNMYSENRTYSMSELMFCGGSGFLMLSEHWQPLKVLTAQQFWLQARREAIVCWWLQWNKEGRKKWSEQELQKLGIQRSSHGSHFNIY